MLTYGRNVFYETLKFAPKTIKKIIIQEKIQDQKLLLAVQNSGISYKFMKKNEMDKLVNQVHQGIILDVTDYSYSSLDEILDNSNFIVMLDHIEDVHNFGAIIRTCEAAGVDGIIIPKDRGALVTPTVMKTSAASLLRMKIAKVNNLVQTINLLKKKGFWVIGTDMDGDDFRNIDYNGKICLIIGNEGKGISSLVIKNCDFVASIPMYGSINSLNASVSAGIMIYEVIRNRK